MRDLQLELQARAEACRYASENAVTPEQREPFDILAVLWTAPADDCRTCGHWHVAEEVQEVSALYAEALAATRRSMH